MYENIDSAYREHLVRWTGSIVRKELKNNFWSQITHVIGIQIQIGPQWIQKCDLIKNVLKVIENLWWMKQRMRWDDNKI